MEKYNGKPFLARERSDGWTENICVHGCTGHSYRGCREHKTLLSTSVLANLAVIAKTALMIRQLDTLFASNSLCIVVVNVVELLENS